MLKKRFAFAAAFLSVMMVFTGCQGGASNSTSSAASNTSSGAADNASQNTSSKAVSSLPGNNSGSTASSSASAGSGSKPLASGSGNSEPSGLLRVQNTIQKTMPYGEYIVGWLNSGTVLYREGAGKTAALRAYTPKTGADTAFLSPKDGTLSDIAISPDGKRLAYDVTNAGSSVLYVMDLSAKSVTGLYQHVNSPQWVDNSKIIFQPTDQNDGNEYPFITDLSGHITRLAKIAGSAPGGTYRYGPLVNNRLYYLGGSMQVPNDLYTYDLAKGSSIRLLKNLDCLFFSPDRKSIFTEQALNVSMDNGSKNAIELISPEGKVERVIRNTESSSREGDIYSAAWSSDSQYVAYSITPNDQADAGVYLYNPAKNTSTKIESCRSDYYGTFLNWNPSGNSLACTFTKGKTNNLSSVFKIYYFD